jgi:hypothetical protein
MNLRAVIAFALALVTMPLAHAALPVKAHFTGVRSEHTWTLADLDPELPADWDPFDFLVIEFKASSSQRFDLGIDTANGRIARASWPI